MEKQLDNLSTLVSTMATTLATSLKVLNNLNHNDEQILNVVSPINQTLSDLTTELVDVKQIQSDNQEVVKQLVHQLKNFEQNTLERQSATQKTLTALNQTIVDLISIIDANSTDESISEARTLIMNRIDNLDYQQVLTKLIESIQIIQTNFESETQHLKVLRKDIAQMEDRLTRFSESNETLASRISSIDVRTSLMLEDRAETLAQSDDMDALNQQIEMLKSVTSSSEQSGRPFD